MIRCHCEVCGGQATFTTVEEFDAVHAADQHAMLVELVTDTELRPYTGSVASVRQMFDWDRPR